MTRIYKNINTKKSKAQVESLVSNYLRNEGFKYEEYRGDYYSPLEPYLSDVPTGSQLVLSKKEATGEMVWRKGRGWFMTPKFIMFDYSEGNVILQGWGLGPDVGGNAFLYVQERVVGSPRMKRRLRELEEMISDEK